MSGGCLLECATAVLQAFGTTVAAVPTRWRALVSDWAVLLSAGAILLSSSCLAILEPCLPIWLKASMRPEVSLKFRIHIRSAQRGGSAVSQDGMDSKCSQKTVFEIWRDIYPKPHS